MINHISNSLRLYNNCKSPTHKLLEYLSFLDPNDNTEIRLQTTQHNNLDFVSLTIVHFSNAIRNKPTIAQLYTNGLNNQLTHQRFDHRSMETIIKMRKDKLLNRIPHNVTKFHNEYACPICILTKATKMKQNKITPSRAVHQKGELLCMDYSFWNEKSIRGFTSLLSVICMKTRFAFAFPTRHKRPPLATISWLISTL